MTPVVRVQTVSKWFRDATAARTLKEVVHRRRQRSHPVEALHEVDLEVSVGESLGVVGPNGAGKTTLLRIVAGVLAPNAGTVERHGRVGSLLELGTGFHPDLTGRESAVLAGVIAGLARREAKQRVDWVCEFAGLERFIDRPLRTYSSGMQARLAFAIATESQPEILLVDEVLAVGDVAFQQRCLERLRSFKRSGSTILLVSHQPDLVRLLCDRVMRLEAGRVVDDGTTAAVLDAYVRGERPAAARSSAAQAGQLVDVRVLDERGADRRVTNVGAPMVVSVRLRPEAGRAHLAVQIVRDDGLLCVDTSTTIVPAQDAAALLIERLDLAPGCYRIAVGIYDPSWQILLDERPEAATVQVVGTASTTAALAPPAIWSDHLPDVD